MLRFDPAQIDGVFDQPGYLSTLLVCEPESLSQAGVGHDSIGKVLQHSVLVRSFNPFSL